MKAFKVFVVVGAILTASAAVAAPPIPTLESVKAGTYKVESYHTEVGFSLSHFGFTNYSGLFSGATGSLRLDPGNLATTRLEVSVPVQSILTTVPVLTDELKGDKWFDVAKFPQADFTSTNVSVGPSGELTITGNLTLHGTTRPIVLHARLVGVGVNPIDKQYTVGFQANGTIKRSDFGISLYAPALGDDVELSIAGAFELQG
jgi:polyisoprenoid-binding protein YceI